MTTINIENAKARKFAEVHRMVWENPHHLGEVEKVWQDEDGNFCILYSCGEWYHYRMTKNGLEWW